LNFKNILVFRIGHLGDTVVSLPAFWRVRNAFPSARITLLSNVDPQNPHYVSARDVLPETMLFDEWIAYPATPGKAGSLLDFKDLYVRLRGGSFDAAVYLMTRNRTRFQINRDVIFFRLAGISKIFGANYLRKNHLALNCPRPSPVVGKESHFLWDCLSFDGFPNENDAPSSDMLLTDAEKTSADKWLWDNKLDSNLNNVVAVAPGSKWESKIWPEERYAEVVERLMADHDVFPIIFGGAEDRETGQRLLRRFGKGANAAGVLNVREAASVLHGCRLYLGNDTGTMHLAAAVGTPCVAIFAAIDWAGRWAPFGESNVIFRQNVECEGCHSPLCFNNNKCLRLVGVREVYEACSQTLRSRLSK
jgi:ADP-heptose:LPS heptosyltransferase